MKRRRGYVVVVVILLMSTSTYAFFGFDTAPIVAALTEQLVVLREGLRTANRTLGSVKALREGVNQIRDYRWNDAKRELLDSDPTLRDLRREWRILRGGGHHRSGDLRRLPEILQDVYSLPAFGEERIPPKRVITAHQISQNGLVDAAVAKDITSPFTQAQGQEVFEYARQSRSGAEASKVTAEGMGLLLQSQADQMRLEAQQLEVQSAQLQIGMLEEAERMRGQDRDVTVMESTFRRLGRLR